MKHSKTMQQILDQREKYIANVRNAAELIIGDSVAQDQQEYFLNHAEELKKDTLSARMAREQQAVAEKILSIAAALRESPVENAVKTTILEHYVFSLDIHPTDDGSKRTPDEWFDYWRAISGKEMATAGEFYKGWKQLKKDYESGNAEKVRHSSTILEGFRDDFDWNGQKNYLIAGTGLEYQDDSLDAVIIHHYRAKDPALVKKTPLEIPEYLDVPIATINQDKKGLHYLQTLLDTQDEAEIMIQTLEFIANKPRAKIKIWTPPLNSIKYYTRKNYPNRAACFNYDGGSFRVDGGNINDRGRSRGVDVNPPKAAR